MNELIARERSYLGGTSDNTYIRAGDVWDVLA